MSRTPLTIREARRKCQDGLERLTNSLAIIEKRIQTLQTSTIWVVPVGIHPDHLPAPKDCRFEIGYKAGWMSNELVRVRDSIADHEDELMSLLKEERAGAQWDAEKEVREKEATGSQRLIDQMIGENEDLLAAEESLTHQVLKAESNERVAQKEILDREMHLKVPEGVTNHFAAKFEGPQNANVESTIEFMQSIGFEWSDKIGETIYYK